MAQILDNRTGLDQTVIIYDEFYNFQLKVNANEFDIVHGYFLSVCPVRAVAENFTSFLFRISQYTGTPVLDLLRYIEGLSDKLEMNKVIAFYLNSFKSKTSLYGVSFIPQTNKNVARNILQ